MARIDSILGIAVQQGCDELRLASDIEPKILSMGTAKRLALPAMGTDMIRDLLGEILTPEREADLAIRNRVDLKYTTESGVPFDVVLTRKGEGIESRFLKSGMGAPAAPVASRPRVAAAAPISVREPVAAEVAPAVEPAPTSPAAEAGTWALSDAAVELCMQAAELGASDLHLRDAESPSIRVDGGIRRWGHSTIDDLGAFLGLDAGSLRVLSRGGSLDRAITYGHGSRGRAHVYRSADGLAAAIRFLPHAPPSLSGLGASVPLDDLIHIPHGLVLVCGATGSGKSTTLASLAAEVLRLRSIVLVTLEHPIEYRLPAGDASIVRQREVGRDARDFATGLRDVMREDPDVIVVGEMRDPETIALALTAAETGHLVIATLHSGSCGSAVERIVDSYPAERQTQIRTQLADVLRVVVAQRLVPRARGRGRLLALEVLRCNHAAGSLIREGKTHQIASLIQSGKKDGMQPLERSLADRVSAGEVRLEDARAAANDPSALERYLSASPR